MQEWAAQLSERNWRNAVLVHNTNLFLHDWLKRAALKEAFCAFCCRSVPSPLLLKESANLSFKYLLGIQQYGMAFVTRLTAAPMIQSALLHCTGR